MTNQNSNAQQATPLTETVMMLDGTVYTIKTRLGWAEQQRCDASAFKILINGRAAGGLGEMQDLSDLDEVEIRLTPDLQNTMRLQMRLVSHTPRQAMALPLAHVTRLVARIAGLEAEEKAELQALNAGDEERPAGPLGRVLRDSATTPSS